MEHERPPDTRLRVETFLPAETVKLVNGGFYILAGGVERVGFINFPGSLNLDIAVRLVVPFTETNRTISFVVRVDDEDGNDILPRALEPKVTVGRPVDLTRGEEQRICFPLLFDGIQIPKAGWYTFALWHADDLLASTKVLAIQATSDMIPPEMR